MFTSAPSVSNPARVATAKPRANLKFTPPKAPSAKRCASSPASEEDEDGEAEGDDDDDDSGSDESGESQEDGSQTHPSMAFGEAEFHFFATTNSHGIRYPM